MTRQYIGARYVPRFMGEYDPTQIYEALDVVDNGLGTSYISKIPTPAGTPLTDTTHWAVYGAQSGAYIGLQNQIDDINNNVIPPIQNDIGTLQNDVNTINNTTIPGLVGSFEPKIANRKFIIIADSYGEERNGDNDNFIDVARKYLDLDNAHFIDCHLSSSGFSQTGALSFLTMLQNVSVDRNSVTDIVVFAGANDIAPAQADTIAGLSAFMTWVKANMPNATVHLGHVGIVLTITGMYNRLIHSLPVYKECAKYGALYMKDSEFVLHSNNSLKVDHVHPKDSDVINYMGLQLATAILTGSCNVRIDVSGTPVVNPTDWPDCSYVSGSYISHVNKDRFAVEGGPNGLMLEVAFGAISGTPWNPNRDILTHLFSFPDFPFIGTAGNVTYISALAVIKDNSNVLHSLPCRILIDGDRDSDNRIYATPIIDSLTNLSDVIEISFYTYGCAYGLES